jgi:hypothetical protein
MPCGENIRRARVIAQALIIGGATLLVLYTYRWWPKRPKRNRYVGHKSDPNIHVPRITRWDRARRHYGSNP